MRDYPIPQRMNLLILALQAIGLAAAFFLLRIVDVGWQLAALAAGFAILMNSVYATMHEAEHGILLRSRRWNDLVGVVLGLFVPVPFHLARQGHLGHHQRNRSDDEAFDFYFAGESPVWKHVQLYGILTGSFWLMLVLSNPLVAVAPGLLKRKHFEFDRPTAALVDSLNPRYRWLVCLEGWMAVLLHAGLVLGLGLPLVSYLLIYGAFGLSWSAMQYVHHFGTPRHVVDGARNLYLWAPIDRVWLNHNWHHTHHHHPTIPWIYLPSLGELEGRERSFLLTAYLRMWRGPRFTNEHVENRYAGRIIH
jgi:fatty acid desaturase